jgi:hypothetical protein
VFVEQDGGSSTTGAIAASTAPFSGIVTVAEVLLVIAKTIQPQHTHTAVKPHTHYLIISESSLSIDKLAMLPSRVPRRPTLYNASTNERFDKQHLSADRWFDRRFRRAPLRAVDGPCASRVSPSLGACALRGAGGAFRETAFDCGRWSAAAVGGFGSRRYAGTAGDV